MRLSLHILIVPVLLVLGLSSLESRAANPPIDPAATAILKRMTDYLGNLEQFSVHTQSTLEDLNQSGHRIDLDVFAKVIISRPNRIRSERKGAEIDQIFYYDGKNVTLFNPSSNVYSTVEAPDSYYDLFQFLYESLGLGLPISDLILDDAYQLLMQDVSGAQRVGMTYLDGVKCEHLLFNRPGVDFQVWVSKGDKPLPLKYVVTDTATPSRLSITTRMNDWDVDPIVDDSQFSFVQPEGAQSIEFITF